MFEQSILLPEHDHKKPWTFAASVMAEVSVVSIVLLLPLIYTEGLGPGMIQPLRIAPPLARPQTLPLEPTIVHRSPTRVFNPFSVPRHIRPLAQVLATIDDAPPPMCANCVAGSLPATDGVPGLIGLNQPLTIAPPPARPVEVKKPVEAAPPTGPFRVSQGTQEARIIRRVVPTYPPLAKQVRVQGTVRLQGVIGVDGRIQQLQVLSGHPLLVQAAIDAVKQWLYRPTLLSGKPVEVIAPIDVNFILVSN
ncbi:MAG TPA: TonB family protein [Bryobacteraceae bacterium]|jgi:protein TonB